jgi:hypothetical protein
MTLRHIEVKYQQTCRSSLRDRRKGRVEQELYLLSVFGTKEVRSGESTNLENPSGIVRSPPVKRQIPSQ